jgi:hypothetical protein
MSFTKVAVCSTEDVNGVSIYWSEPWIINVGRDRNLRIRCYPHIVRLASLAGKLIPLLHKWETMIQYRYVKCVFFR